MQLRRAAAQLPAPARLSFVLHPAAWWLPPPPHNHRCCARCFAALRPSLQEWLPSHEQLLFLIDAAPEMLEPCTLEEPGVEDKVGRQCRGEGGVGAAAGGRRGLGPRAGGRQRRACIGAAPPSQPPDAPLRPRNFPPSLSLPAPLSAPPTSPRTLWG